MLRELLARFNIDASQAIKELQTVDKKLEGAKSTLQSLGEAFVGSKIVGGVRDFISHQIELGSQINDLSEKLGIGTDDLQQWQFAAKLVGVEGEGAAASLGFLNKNMGLALEGNKEAVETFTKLGVSLRDGAGNVRELGDVIPEIADSFEHMESAQERTATAMKIFGKQGAALIPLLKDGSGGLKKMYAEFERLGGGMDKGFIESADKAGDEIDKLKFALNGWKSQIAFVVLPTLTRFVEHLQGWVGGLRQVTRETHLAQEMVAVFGVASGIAGFKAAAGFAQFLGVLPKDAGFWKTVLGLGEIGLIIIGIAILALAFEDFFSMLNGDESIIGDLMDEFLGLGTTKELVKELGDAWAILSGLFATDLESLKPLLDIFKELGKSAIPYAVASFVDMVRVVAGLVVLFGAFVKGFAQLASLDFEGVGKTIKAAGSLFAKGGLLGGSAVYDLNKRNEAKDDAHALGTDRAESIYVPAGERLSRGAVTQRNQIDVTVQGGRDAQETGNAVKEGVSTALDQTLADALGASF